MKTTRISLLRAIVFLAVQSWIFPGYCGEFMEIVRTDRWIISIDMTSMEERDGYFTAWARKVPLNENLEAFRKSFGPSYSYHMERRAYNRKSKGEDQLLDGIAYDGKGMVIDEVHFRFSHDKYISSPPGSVAEFMWMKVMDLSGVSGKAK